MHLCYIDESGVSSIPGNSSHFVLAGLSIPIWEWKGCDQEIQDIKSRYSLNDAEIHTAWIWRDYKEQHSINNFSTLSRFDRAALVKQKRTADILRLQKSGNRKAYRQALKNYKQTEKYFHLTLSERRSFINDVAAKIASWQFARLFADCIDKVHFDPSRSHFSLDQVAFEQVVSRFEQYLTITSINQRNFGLLIHDNNETVAKKHTELMKKYHVQGTLWTGIRSIIETPLFVNSTLTSMVQLADLCAFALRRFVENQEAGLFNQIFQRADRKDGVVVGVRHFTNLGCTCHICTCHRQC